MLTPERGRRAVAGERLAPRRAVLSLAGVRPGCGSLPLAQPDLPFALQELRGSDTELPRDRPAGPMGQVGAPVARMLASLLACARIITSSSVFQVPAVDRRMSSPSRKTKPLAQSPGAACEEVFK